MSVKGVLKAGAILSHGVAAGISFYVMTTTKNPRERQVAKDSLAEDLKNIKDSIAM